jgi:hypothetical protein
MGVLLASYELQRFCRPLLLPRKKAPAPVALPRHVLARYQAVAMMFHYAGAVAQALSALVELVLRC